jgi:hypothetical protein
MPFRSHRPPPTLSPEALTKGDAHRPFGNSRAFFVIAALVLTSVLSLSHPAFAACSTKEDCQPGEGCGENNVCKIVAPGTICVNNSTCGLTHECKEGKCAAPEVRQGVTTVEQTETTPKLPPIIPQLNVPIPGLTLGGGPGDDGSAIFSQYVAGAYRYAISIVAVAATVMFTFGAFLYLLGSAITSIQKGKQYMIDAVIGLLLVFGAIFILRTLNPATVNMKQVLATPVTQWEVGNFNPSDPPGSGTALSIPAVLNTHPKKEIAQDIILAAKEVGVDPCVMLAICEHETGLRSVWNGIQSKNPIEKAICFGPCQVAAANIGDDRPITRLLRQDYPDFPPPQVNPNKMSNTEKVQRGNWLMNNVRGSARVAAYLYKSAVNMYGGNEVTALGAYSAGGGSMNVYNKANGCSPQAGIKIKDASPASLGPSCIPHIIAIPTLGEPPKGCPEDKYTCPNAKADSTAQFTGMCSSPPRKCFAMITDQYALSVIKRYPSMVSSYKCDQ